MMDSYFAHPRGGDYAIRRLVHDSVLSALADTRVVMLMGARQVGKSTLASAIASDDRPMQVVTLDDATLRDAAATDPAGFLADHSRPLVVDEVQRAPDLLLAIKEIVDRDGTPGQFLLTGSANILAAPRIRDALTGRAEYITLWPLSQVEISGARSNFVDRLFARDPPDVVGAAVGRAAFVDVVARGGYPDVRDRPGARRRAWYRSYLGSLIERDLRELSDARMLDVVPRLLRLVATQAADVFVPARIAAELQISQETVSSYINLLTTSYLVRRTRSWTPRLAARELRHPKIHVVDSGLLAYLLRATEQRISTDDRVTGRMLENFVAMEIERLADVSAAEPDLYHYRLRDGRGEIDIVLETPEGSISAIEVKAAATVERRDYKTMVNLRESRPEFVAGVVLYTGARTVPLGDRLWAVPINGLWSD